ncbi:hypothetical protein, partial [Candidatus Entotheonella palauensis]|uniref:hypothetical protein n=1 Tax=Candidatus Entotheonella palauensis TaxID=93172 RepID=UPI0011785917
MQTIHRKPHSVNDRSSHQTSRPGWRPRQCSPKQRARFIAESIKARIAEGRGWSLAEYGIDTKPDMIQLVNQHLQ